MSLSIGTRLGPYEITALLGAGGMGEVYRARDTKLNRDVALKILPEAFALDPDRLARFKREAQVLASLNHPNIAAICGLEESDGVRALVLELVEGPTLADRIARGAVPLDEALPIARQIAEALEAAHEHAIIHRDLKPANIKVREDGTVKVLDFGLAKALEGEHGGPDISQSPTMSVAATRAGVILGTAAYMSPEQARGKPIDKRRDIWAFGCVLFEMLTGRRAFQGEDVTQVLARVVEREPDFSALPPRTPESVRRILSRCLRKERKERLPDIGVARMEMAEAVAMPTGEAVALVVAAQSRAWPRRATLAVAVALVAGSLVTGVAVWNLKPQGPQQVVRVTVTPRVGEPLLVVTGRNCTPPCSFEFQDVAISPDGRRIVYSGGTSTSGSLLRNGAARRQTIRVKRVTFDELSYLPGR